MNLKQSIINIVLNEGRYAYQEMQDILVASWKSVTGKELLYEDLVDVVDRYMEEKEWTECRQWRKIKSRQEAIELLCAHASVDELEAESEVNGYNRVCSIINECTQSGEYHIPMIEKVFSDMLTHGKAKEMVESQWNHYTFNKLTAPMTYDEICDAVGVRREELAF